MALHTIPGAGGAISNELVPLLLANICLVINVSIVYNRRGEDIVFI